MSPAAWRPDSSNAASRTGSTHTGSEHRSDQRGDGAAVGNARKVSAQRTILRSRCSIRSPDQMVLQRARGMAATPSGRDRGWWSWGYEVSNGPRLPSERRRLVDG